MISCNIRRLEYVKVQFQFAIKTNIIMADIIMTDS